MNGKVAKRLRREAKQASTGEPMLEIRQRKKWFGEIDEVGNKILRAVWGTLRHKEGTVRQTYKKLKTIFNKGG